MKLETILNAYDKVHQTIIAEAGGWLFLSFEHISKRNRQYRAFRTRILRMGTELAWCKRELDLERRINLEESDD